MSGNQTINPIPLNSPNLFYPQLQTFLKQETANVLGRYFNKGFIISGGIHGTSLTTVTEVFSTEAVMNNGDHVTTTGSIDYAAPNIGGNAFSDTCWVIISSEETPTIAGTNFQRVGQTQYYVDTASPVLPPIPASGCSLMQVTLSNGQIIGVAQLPKAYHSPVSSIFGEVFIRDFATSGDGSVNSPYRGWERAFVNLQPYSSLVFTGDYYDTSSQLPINQDFITVRGISYNSTKLTYTLAGSTDLGVFQIGKADGSVVTGVDIGNLSIDSTNASFTKVGLRVLNASQCHFHDMRIGSSTWISSGGNPLSVGIYTNGISYSSFSNIVTGADTPVFLGKSSVPANVIDVQFVTFRDMVYVCNSTISQCFLITNATIQNLVTEGYQRMFGGLNGFYWNDGNNTGAAASASVKIQNIAWESAVDPNGYAIVAQAGSQFFHNIEINTAYLGTTNNGGIFLHRCINSRIQNVTYAGTNFGLTWDSSNQGLSIANCFWGTGLNGIHSLAQYAFAAFATTATSSIPSDAVIGSFTAEYKQEIFITNAKLWQTSGPLANGATIGPFQPGITGDTVVSIVTVSFGGQVSGGGQVNFHDGNGLTLLSGTSNFGVGNQPGKLTVVLSGLGFGLLNQTGFTVNFIIHMSKVP